MRRWLLAFVLLLAASAAVAQGLPRTQACGSLSAPTAVSGFAPLTPTDQKDVTTSSFTCYVLFPKPSFGYHGEIRLTLSDGVSTAVYHANYVLAGVTMEERIQVTHPDLNPGVLTLRGESRVNDVIAVGTWEGDVQFGFEEP